MQYAVMVLALGALVSAGSAYARDHVGYTAIAAGDLRAAETAIAAERRIFPDKPELLLNLAAVYARTGRIAEARDLYRATLAQDDVTLELADGNAFSSHTLARTGLTRTTTVVATR